MGGAGLALPQLVSGQSSRYFYFAIIADTHIIDDFYKGPEGNALDTESIFKTSERLISARNLINSLNHNGISFLVSATPQAVVIIIRLTFCSSATVRMFFMDTDRKSLDVRSLAQGKSEVREILRVLSMASQPCIASASVYLFNGVPSNAETNSGFTVSRLL